MTTPNLLGTKPAMRPARPEFSSGPCAKRPGWTPENLRNAVLGRSHRSKLGKAKLGEVLDRSPRPSLYREARSADGTLLHAGGIDRLGLIERFPVTDLATGQDRLLRDCGRLYGDRWLQLMGPSTPRS